MNVKAKVLAMFEKFPFLKNFNKYLRQPHQDCLERPVTDDSLTPLQEQLKTHFASICGICIYLSITCRPDIATLVGKACKGMHGPTKLHILYLETLVKYLKSSADWELVYSKSNEMLNLLQDMNNQYAEMKEIHHKPVVAFSDADWLPKADDGEQMRSMLRFADGSY